MEHACFGSKIVLRLDKGEEVVESVRTFCRIHEIKLALLTGIGAVNEADVGIFIQESKSYYTKKFVGSMEITSLAGNISQMDGQTYVHVHVTLTDATYQAYGGHLNAARVGATCEIIIDVINGQMDRQFNEQIGLNLMKF